MLHLRRTRNLSTDEIDAVLNSRSGLLALAGDNDMREVHRRAAAGDAAAELALDVYCYRIRKYVGAYLAALGGADAIVFTAGVGENDPIVRARSLAGLERLGIAVDPARNAAGETVISPDGSRGRRARDRRPTRSSRWRRRPRRWWRRSVPFAAWRHRDARDGFEVVFIDGRRFEGHSVAVEDGRAVRGPLPDRTRRALADAVGADLGPRGQRPLEGDGEGHWRVDGAAVRPSSTAAWTWTWKRRR